MQVLIGNDESAQNPREVEEGTNDSFPAAQALGAESQWEEICKAGQQGEMERDGVRS